MLCLYSVHGMYSQRVLTGLGARLKDELKNGGLESGRWPDGVKRFEIGTATLRCPVTMNGGIVYIRCNGAELEYRDGGEADICPTSLLHCRTTYTYEVPVRCTSYVSLPFFLFTSYTCTWHQNGYHICLLILFSVSLFLLFEPPLFARRGRMRGKNVCLIERFNMVCATTYVVFGTPRG